MAPLRRGFVVSVGRRTVVDRVDRSGNLQLSRNGTAKKPSTEISSSANTRNDHRRNFLTSNSSGDIMSKNKVVSRVSETLGSDIRHVYTEDGERNLGMIIKLGRGKYRVLRVDGKERTKETLTEAFKTIRRAN